ncbi:marine proteobacterial sortase target protein [Maricaulis sp.]|uniref:marine proteobacterial sortase target protein n=1 Tax=Maricaulis sp. TaxID=1486257 RepID=UPI0025C121AE|nr:marine proteobacterial sortase target protein [Maricaulis sp.]
MAAARTHTSAGSLPFFALTLAVAAFAVSLLLWSDARADSVTDTPEPAGIDESQLVRLSEINEGALLIRTVEPGRYLPAPMVATDLAFDISGPVIRATITQRFQNPSDAWVEASYVFPLPEDSGVDRLRMQVGNRFIEGEIQERQAARRTYETARRNGQRASLVEQERPNMFTTSVANIGPGETIIVQLEYQSVARFADGRYELRQPLGLTPRYIPEGSGFLPASTGAADSPAVPDAGRITPPLLHPSAEPRDQLRLPVTITADLDAGFALGEVASLYHATRVERLPDETARIALAAGPIPANRDFVLTWRAADPHAASAALFIEEWQGETYLLAQVLPPAEMSDAIPRRDRETIFVIDNSGSMAGASMRQARAALITALQRLEPTDRFNVIRFDNTMDQLFPQAVPANPGNITTALAFARRLEAEGGTVMLPALNAALRDTRSDSDDQVRQVVFLTDGAIGNEAQLFSAIDAGLGRSRLFPVGIGSAPNSYFMSRAARLGRGTFTHIGQVSEVEARMEALFTALERPVMTDLDVLFPDEALSEIWPAPLPDLYHGEPVTLTARLGRRDGVMVIEGALAGAMWRETLSLANAREGRGIAALFGRNRIRALEEARFQGASQAGIDAAVLQTALDFDLVSRLTSLVAVDVTPARPDGTPLASRDVPAMTPQGWDLDTVREREPGPVQHARADARLFALPAPVAGGEAERSNGLALPATATPRELLMGLGALMMILALIWLVTRREERLW